VSIKRFYYVVPDPESCVANSYKTQNFTTDLYLTSTIIQLQMRVFKYKLQYVEKSETISYLHVKNHKTDANTR